MITASILIVELFAVLLGAILALPVTQKLDFVTSRNYQSSAPKVYILARYDVPGGNLTLQQSNVSPSQDSAAQDPHARSEENFQHTIGHVGCPACEAARIEAMDSGSFAELPFSAASQVWLASKIGRKAERTTDNDRYHIRCLEKFFGPMRLKDIHAGHLITYQQWRPTASKRKAGPSCINHEMSVLQQILKRAGRWNAISEWYAPLPLPKKGPGRALEPAEEDHLFITASSDTRWKVAYCSCILTNNTTAGPGEIRKLRLMDVDQKNWIMTVREGAKNDGRVRAIPLNQEAQLAMHELLRLAKRKGATLPEHYLLPHRGKGGGADLTRPMHSWKKAWYSLRARAAEEMPSLATLRPYDLRHHSITRLLENPEISEQTVKDIAGHVSKHILERYSHIRMAKKRDALGALCRKPALVVKKEPEKEPRQIPSDAANG